VAINPELLKILVCPACRKKIEMADNGQFLFCGNCRLRFPIQDDIPVMLLDQARPLED